MPDETPPAPARWERVVCRIESGDIGLIGEMLEAAGKWAQEEYPECKLVARNAPGVTFELVLVEKEEEKP